MAISSKKSQKNRIDLDGPDGNAYYLLGTAKQLAKQLKLNGEQIVQEMMTGDYDNLLLTFEKYFGDYIVLETENEHYLGLFNSSKHDK